MRRHLIDKREGGWKIIVITDFYPIFSRFSHRALREEKNFQLYFVQL